MIEKVRSRLDSLSYLIDEESLDVEFLDEESIIVSGRLIFVNGMKFDFREFRSPNEHDYRFHLMDS